MKVALLGLLAAICCGLSLTGCTTGSTKPEVANIGVILALKSVIGKVGKVAIDAAIDDINSNPAILHSTKLNMTVMDSKYSGFLGIAEALQLLEKDTIAIIGPQSSVTAHVIGHIANVLQVPLLSFSSTDPTLSPIQFPFFVRTSQNDEFQMSAIADIVEHYGWRDVIAVYQDDDHGRNGIAVLGDKLNAKQCKISFKANLSPNEPTRDEITGFLVKVALMESRIIVVHLPGSWGLKVFSVAQYLGMVATGYVFIATNWLSTVLDTSSPLPQDVMESIQGVLTLRMYAPDTEAKSKFISRWSSLAKGKNVQDSVGINAYALYAYDTVWILAHAIDSFLNQGGNISFSDLSLLQNELGNLHLDALSVFDEGHMLLQKILQVNMNGVTGQVKFTSQRDIINPAYEIINFIGNGYRKIGYWSNHSHLTTAPLETLWGMPPNLSSSNQKLYSVIWPGESTERPRGWVFPNDGRHLKIGVSKCVSYREFVSVGGPDNVNGYCIDVFTAAVNLLPYAVPYKFVPFGDGRTNPSGSELVRLITTGEFDAAVGDIAITTNRTRMVDFTQPYIESGLVVAPVKKKNSNGWAFLMPFTTRMWGVTTLFFVVVGLVVWFLEHKKNDEFRGPPKKQITTILWFSFSTLFFAHRENTISSLGRTVLIIWLFVVFIIKYSYTASLTSILTVQRLSSPIKGIETLMSSKDLIGFPEGSFAQNYLVEELKIDPSRLIPFNSPEEVAKALTVSPKGGGVVAMVDERANSELFLSSRCEFSIVSQEFTKNGWGFAFPKDSPLAVDMSTAILKLSENGDLQRIHDKWLLRRPCSSEGAKTNIDQLPFRSFWGLFLICGLACVLALMVYLGVILFKFNHHYSEEHHSDPSLHLDCLRTFLSFIDGKEEKVKNRSKRRQLERESIRTDDSYNSQARSSDFFSSNATNNVNTQV